MEYLNDQTSPLVKRVLAFEQVQRVEQYLFVTTYASDGAGSRCWSQWYADIQDAVEILRDVEHDLRRNIAHRLSAVLREEI